MSLCHFRNKGFLFFLSVLREREDNSIAAYIVNFISFDVHVKGELDFVAYLDSM